MDLIVSLQVDFPAACGGSLFDRILGLFVNCVKFLSLSPLPSDNGDGQNENQQKQYEFHNDDTSMKLLRIIE